MSTCAGVSQALGTQVAMHLGQKLLNRLETSGEPGALGPEPPARPQARSPSRASYLDRESRRVRQEGRDRGKGTELKGDTGVFLTMRYRVLITLLVAGAGRALRLEAAEKTQKAVREAGGDMAARPPGWAHPQPAAWAPGGWAQA